MKPAPPVTSARTPRAYLLSVARPRRTLEPSPPLWTFDRLASLRFVVDCAASRPGEAETALGGGPCARPSSPAQRRRSSLPAARSGGGTKVGPQGPKGDTGAAGTPGAEGDKGDRART